MAWPGLASNPPLPPTAQPADGAGLAAAAGLWPQWRRGPPFPAFRATPGPRAALAAAAAVTSSEAGSDSDDSTLRRPRRPPRLPPRMPLAPVARQWPEVSDFVARFCTGNPIGPTTRRRPLAARPRPQRPLSQVPPTVRDWPGLDIQSQCSTVRKSIFGPPPACSARQVAAARTEAHAT